ncbi:glycosyltransferase family 87 protein [Nocardioides cavernaquae]|nr:glycosyltransferase family 87 protein [Nocardioides cavernaquae]
MTGFSWFVAPPFVAVLLAPLGALAYLVAAFCFAVINGLALAVIIRGLLHLAPGIRREDRRLVVLGCVAFPPVFEAFAAGQMSLIFLALWVTAMRCAADGRPVWAGMLLALAAFKPHLVLLVPCALIARRDWRALAGYVVVGSGLLLVSFAAVGQRGMRNWVDALGSAAYRELVGSGQAWKTISLAAWGESLPATRGLGILSLGVGAIAVFMAARTSLPDPLRDLAVLSLLTVVFSPHAMLYDGVLLLPIAIWLLSAGLLVRARWLLLVIWVLLFSTSMRHALAEAVPLLGWADLPLAALPMAVLVWRLRQLDGTDRARATRSSRRP